MHTYTSPNHQPNVQPNVQTPVCFAKQNILRQTGEVSPKNLVYS